MRDKLRRKRALQTLIEHAHLVRSLTSAELNRHPWNLFLRRIRAAEKALRCL
jgi:hypothetical protein